MRSSISTTTLLAVAAAWAGTSQAVEIGAAVTDGNDDFATFTAGTDWDIPGDMFGIRSRVNPDPPGSTTFAGLPFAIADDSVSINPGDTQGIIGENDLAPFFGLVDNVNNSNTDPQQAVWTFDVAGFSNLAFSIDFAAMGDFEASDSHNFTASIDGGTPQVIYAGSVAEDIDDAPYMMDDGTQVLLNDPLLINGTQLTNEFTALSANVAGTGSVLTLTYEGLNDAGTEAFAFRNVLLTGDAGGGVIDGDYNDSGLVEQGDLDQVLSNWGAGFAGIPATWVNQRPTEGIVDQAELDVVLTEWGSSSAPSFAGSAVPEPATLALLGLGGLALLRRRA